MSLDFLEPGGVRGSEFLIDGITWLPQVALLNHGQRATMMNMIVYQTCEEWELDYR